LIGFLGEDGVVENSVATNVNITGVRDVGGLIGNITTRTRLWNNTVNGGTVTASNTTHTHSSPYAGGLVGRASGTDNIIYAPIVNNVTATSYNPAFAGPVFGGPAGNATLYYVHNETQDVWYSTIKAAVNASVDGDVVRVYAGTYDEEDILINKSIQLLGAPGHASIIAPSGATNNSTIKVVNPSGNVLIDGFTFNNPPRPSHGATILTSGTAIAVDSATVTVSNNIINGADRGQYNDYGLYGQGNHAAVIWEYNTLNLVGGNPLIFEQQLGSTTVRNNTVYTGDVADGSLYYSMIYGDKTVTTPQIVENNTLSFVRTGDGWSEAITFNTSPTYQWSGSTLYGHYTDIQIRNNTIILGGIKDRGIGLADRSAGAGKGTITGAVIENNTITGQEEHVNENTIGILLRGDVQGTQIKNNTFTTLASGVQLIEQLVNTTPEHEVPSGTIIENNAFNSSVGVALKNENAEEKVDASPNYWGSADGPSGEDLDGPVKFFPFWIDPEMTQLSQVTNTTLAMDPVTLEACEIGSQYIVSVNIGPFYDMSSYQIKVSFDTTKLEVLELINGDVLPGDAIEIKDLGNDTGVLDYSRALYGNQGDWNLIDDPDGGTLMKIKVKTKATGTSVMELLNTSILTRTDDAWPYPYDITNAETTVTTSLYAVRNGTTNYCDLQTAVDEAFAGDTLTVLRDFTVAAPVQVAKEITFNTAGYTVTRTGATSAYDSLFEVQTGGNLSITGGGTLNSTDTDGTTTGALGAALRIVGGEATLVNATLKGDYVGVRVQGNNNSTTWATPTPAVFKMTGGTAYNIVVVGNGGKLDLSGGTVTSAGVYAAIQGSGTVNATYNQGGTEIIIRDNAQVTRTDDDIVIYHPQDGVMTISGGTISGDSPIYMKSGDLTVTGGTISSTGAFVAAPALDSNGAAPTGDAIFLMNQDGYTGDMTLNITGGTIESANGYAVREFTPATHTSRTSSVSISGDTAKLTGGTDAGDAGSAVTFATTAADVLKLTGGAYNVDPKTFVYFPLETYLHTDNYYYIRYMWPVINLRDNSLYPTLADAVNAAQAGDTLLARLDFETTAPVAVEKTITFDTNGKTITRTKATTNYDNFFTVQNNGNLTITGGGTITTTSVDGEKGAAVVVTKGVLNLGLNGNGATLSGDYTSVVIYGNIAGTTPISSTFNMTSGTTTDGIYVFGYGAELNVSGGTVTRSGSRAAISGHGSSAAAGTVINISGDANIIGAADDIAIYHPQNGVLNITGGTITAGSPIHMKSGDLNVSGGTITATGAFSDPSENPSGANATGDAILLLSQTGYTGDLKLNINGGTITSANGYAIREYVLSGPAKIVNATISNGQMSGKEGAVDFATNNDGVLDLIGGAYNTNPAAFVYIPKYVYFDDPWYRIGDMVGPVTGTVSMQGRLERSGVPVKMTGGSVVIPTVYSTNASSGNVSFAYLVPNTTYTFTTAQPRYLNITTDLGKEITILNGDEVITTLRLIGGNAIWTDNEINIQDFGLVTGAFGSTEVTDADVNFDGVVNIRDLTLVAGNYGLTSTTAYANWTP